MLRGGRDPVLNKLKMTPKILGKILQLRKSKLSYRQISSFVPVSHVTCFNWTKRYLEIEGWEEFPSDKVKLNPSPREFWVSCITYAIVQIRHSIRINKEMFGWYKQKNNHNSAREILENMLGEVCK